MWIHLFHVMNKKMKCFPFLHNVINDITKIKQTQKPNSIILIIQK